MRLWQLWTCWNIWQPWMDSCHWHCPQRLDGSLTPLMGPGLPLCIPLTHITWVHLLTLVAWPFVDTAVCPSPPFCSACVFIPDKGKQLHPPLPSLGRKSGNCDEAHSIQWSTANLPVGFIWITCLWQCLGFECFNQGIFIWNQYALPFSYWPERNVHLCLDFSCVNSHFTPSGTREGTELNWWDTWLFWVEASMQICMKTLVNFKQAKPALYFLTKHKF